jgi:S1-C subfamily serine protease
VAELPPMMPGVGTSVWIVSDGMGGAKLESITEGLGKALGVSAGVLVLKVGPGTPAYKSGLRDGDVILRAAGRSVRTVRELRAAAEGDREDGVKLVIQRDKRQRELTLRW